MKRAKPPNVRGRGPLLSEQGFGVAIVCIIKDEADYLEEWLAFHFALGVGHVFLYDNGSTDGSAALLERYQNHGLVTVVDWPLGGGQLAAYNHALRFFGRTADWLAFHDVDEFLVPLLDDDIPTFVARFVDAADVRVPRKEFGFSGHRTRPEGLAIDVYTETANVLALDPDQPPRVKSIVQPGSVSALDAHLAFPADTLPPGAPAVTAEVEVRGIAQLNHYYTRSFEEFEAKRAGSSATGRITRRAVSFDIPTIETDTSAQRFSERTAAMIERLRSLEPRPYYYGSQLGIDQFPRPNDLGRFAEFAIANAVAGLDEPARFAAIRIRNLYDGAGLVGDLSDTGYVPTPGGLARSVHTQVLIEHTRGHLECDIVAHPGRFKATHGRVAVVDGEHRLLLEDQIGVIEVDVPPGASLRCYALGWLFGSDQPMEHDIRLVINVERSDGSQGPKAVLPALPSRLLVGIIEVEPSPQHIERIRLEIQTDVPELKLHDLFLVSYG